MPRKLSCWSSDAESATVLMEYIKRASPQFVAAELDKLSLLDAADEIAAATLGKLARRGSPVRRKLVAMVALAMCATIIVIAETRYFGAMNALPDDGRSRFMQLAGPTPEW
jgi:hypothetical protein